MKQENNVLLEKNLSLFKLWADVMGIVQKNEIVDNSQFENELRELKQKAKENKASKIYFRIFEGTEIDKASVLKKIGFILKDKRMEFKTDLKKLNFVLDQRIIFKSVNELNWSRKDVANFITEVSIGDPNYDSNESAFDFVDDWYEDTVLTVGGDCIFIGILDMVPVAICVPQINQSTKWSRIAYMGVLPSFRKLKFGNSLHQFAIMKLKEMGGEIYQGGTSKENAGMLKLFNKNQCEFYRNIDEWELSLK